MLKLIFLILSQHPLHAAHNLLLIIEWNRRSSMAQFMIVKAVHRKSFFKLGVDYLYIKDSYNT